MDIHTSSIPIGIAICAPVGNYAGGKAEHLDDQFAMGRRAPTLLIADKRVAVLFIAVLFMAVLFVVILFVAVLSKY